MSEESQEKLAPKGHEEDDPAIQSESEGSYPETLDGKQD
jgi:hypothetical protein